jgi:hypothetical protein
MTLRANMLKEVYGFLARTSMRVPTRMLKLDETNSIPYGMIKIKLMSLNNLAFNEKLFIRVLLDPYKVESKKLSG